MEKFRYILKRVGRCFLFGNFSAVMTVLISLISVQLFTGIASILLRVLLESLTLAFYLFCEIMVGMAFGARQYRKKCDNEYRRKPDSRDLIGYYELRDTEYFPSNGILLGFLGNYLLGIAFICYAATAGNSQNFFYTVILGSTSVVTTLLKDAFVAEGAVTPVWFSLFVIPVSTLTVWAGYILGALRVKISKRKVEEMESSLKKGGE